MMADLIDRKSVIDVIHKAIFDFFDIVDDDDESPMTYKDEQLLTLNKAIVTKIEALPSAQPEPSQVARDIATIIENERDMRVIAAQPDVPDIRVGDMISRQAAYEVLSVYYHHKTDIQHRALHEALNRVPAARARWEYVDYGGIGNYHCSRCRAIGKKDYEYCPRCGARMDGERYE